jgi:hypothetical protein
MINKALFEQNFTEYSISPAVYAKNLSWHIVLNEGLKIKVAYH